jgi:hypothetical protein
MLEMLFRSARVFHRNAICTLLTDRQTNIAKLSTRFQRRNFLIDHQALMLSRALAQFEYVHQFDFSHPLLLIDSDILVNGSMASVFDIDFDVGLTWRKNKTMPINGGLIVLNNRRPEVVRNFFGHFISIYRTAYSDSENSRWYGDQLALRDLINLNLEDFSDEKIIMVNGCRVLLLSCDVYNFSPKNKYNEICSDLSEKVILHFKGERKRLMAHFWKAWIKPRSTYSPWDWLLARGARRWLLREAQAERSLDISAKEPK